MLLEILVFILSFKHPQVILSQIRIHLTLNLVVRTEMVRIVSLRLLWILDLNRVLVHEIVDDLLS